MVPDPSAASPHLRHRALDGHLRARESERPDALFRDTLARRLAGERGETIRRQMAAAVQEWAFVTRTVLFDHAIEARIASGHASRGESRRRGSTPGRIGWSCRRSCTGSRSICPSCSTLRPRRIDAERPKCRLERFASTSQTGRPGRWPSTASARARDHRRA